MSRHTEAHEASPFMLTFLHLAQSMSVVHFLFHSVADVYAGCKLKKGMQVSCKALSKQGPDAGSSTKAQTLF